MASDFTFVAAGEILIDFISKEPCVPLKECTTFGKFFGGAPANVAVNMKNLGYESTIVSKVGNDPLGTFLLDFLKKLGIDDRYVTRHDNIPTSMVVMTSKMSPAEFVAFRLADTQLTPDDIPDDLLDGCKIFHTTAHGIARKPTQYAILDAFKRAHAKGKWTSFDPNYSSTFWPDRDEAMDVIAQFLKHTKFCKPSLDDCERMFGKKSKENYLTKIHEWGVEIIMLTMGENGALLSQKDGEVKTYPAINTPDLVDPTGAGDAFTAGFFATYLKTGDMDKAMEVGNKTAHFNLKHLGAAPKLPKVEEFF